LAGLLLLIVVLGSLAAITVVGVNSMTGSDPRTGNLLTTTSVVTHNGVGGNGGLAGVAQIAAAAVCHAEAAAATSASSVYYANSGGRYPTKWPDLTASFALPAHVVVNASDPAELDGNGWKLTMSGGPSAALTFACT